MKIPGTNSQTAIRGYYLFAVGLVSILGQVAVLRELSVAFYGVELIYILAMGIWLFWTAVGASIGKNAHTPSAGVVIALFVIFGLLLPGEVAFARGVRLIFGGISGSYLSFERQLLAIFLILMPMCVLLGLLFQWSAKLYIDKDKTLAGAYAIESAGGVAGGIASTLLLKFGVQNFAIVALCGLLATCTAFVVEKKGIPRFAMLRLICVAIPATVLFFSDEIDTRMTQWNHPALTESRDTPYSRVTVSGRLGQHAVFENDALEFETQSTSAEEFVHVSAIQHRCPERVLVSGGGVEGVVTEVMKHRPKKIDCVELNAGIIDIAKRSLPEKNLAWLASDIVEIHIADPRKFLQDAKPYDFIFTGVSEPSSGRANRFFTREYFELCASKLKKDGVLAFRLRSSENIWTRFLAYRNTSVYRAAKSAFRDVVILPGMTNTVIASNSTLVKDPDELMKRYAERKIKSRLVSPPYINYIYTNDRLFQIAGIVGKTDAPPNTDIHPVCYNYSSMIWLSGFFPRLTNFNLRVSGFSGANMAIIYCLATACLIGIFSYVRKLGIRKPLVVGVAGFSGMVLEAMLILYYQAKSGALYQDVGILFMVFMAGLAAGSVFVSKIMGNGSKKRAEWKIGKAMPIGFSLLSLAFALLIHSGCRSGILVISFFLFFAGFFVSGVFAFAGTAGVKNRKTVVSPLYAADLIGGCAGSLAGSLVLIPFFGMGQCAVMLALVMLAALLLEI